MTTISLKNYLEQIDQLIDDGKFDDAIVHGRHILQSYPRNIEVYKLMGKAHLELRNHDEAIDLLQRVLSADPNDLVAHIGLSMIFKERGEDELSLWHLERAFEIQPYNHAIREELRLLYVRFNDEVPRRLPLTAGAVARLYIRGELYQQAVQTLEPVVSTVQDRLDLEVLLAEALWQGRDDQRIDAEQVCLNVLERLPNSIMANAILATIWLRTGRIGESQKYLARVQDLTCLDYASIDVDTPIGRAFLTDGAPALPKEITLQWLENMPAPKQVQLSSADWMNEMDAEMGGTASAEEVEDGVVQEGESGMHSYDWMMDVEEPGDLAAGAMAAGAVMTDWFAAEDEDVESDSQPATEAEEVPEWLGDLSDEEPKRTGHTDELDYSFLESDPAADATGTDWFADDSRESESNALVDSEVPDWLVGADKDNVEPSAKAVQSDAGDEIASEMPEWLASETGDLAPIQDADGDRTPDWLDNSLEDELDPIRMNSSEADNWLDESDEAGVDMMQDSETEEGGDEFDFLGLPSDDGGDDDWLSEMDDDQVDDDLFAFDSGLTGAKTGESDWLTAANADDEADASLEGDWLSATDEEDTAVSATKGNDDSDWLFGEEEESLTTEADDGAIKSVTSWLSDLDGDDGLSELTESKPAQVDSAPDDDWLHETTLFDTQGESNEVMESVTSWLSDLEADNEIASVTESDTSLADEELDDDWLKQTNLLENVTDIAAAAAVTGWLSDFAEDDNDEEDSADADDGLDDLFAVDAKPEEAGEESEDWLSELPETEGQSAVAGDLGTNWLTEDADITSFTSKSDTELDDEALDDMLAATDEPALADADADLAESGDDWLSVLSQDDFDTGELEEITPEAISEYESEIELDDDLEEDWSAIMYGTDSLSASPLDDTGALADSDFAETALTEEEISNSQYEEIPDWLMTGPLNLDETPAMGKVESEAQDPGDMLDEDDLFDSNPSEMDWEEDQALDWITDLSESEGGESLAAESAADELSPDLADFDAKELEGNSELFSTSELLGFEQDDVPDWMSEEGSGSSGESSAQEAGGFTGLFDFDDEDEGGDEGVTATAVSTDAGDEEAGLTDLLGWGDEDQEDDVSEPALADLPLDEADGLDDILGWDAENDLGSDLLEPAMSDEPLDEADGLDDILGWDAEDELGSDLLEPAMSDEPLDEADGLDDIFGWNAEDELETAVTIASAEESSVTDLFEEDDFAAEFLFDDEVESGEADTELEDVSGLTNFLAGTSLSQSEDVDEGELPSGSVKSQAEFESELPELLSGDETSWLSELDGIGSVESEPTDDKSKIGLDWMTEPEDSFTDLLNTELEEPDLSEIADDEEDEDEFKLEEVDIGEDAFSGDINDAISWLEDLAVQQDAPVEELPTIAQDVLEDDAAVFEETEESLDWLMDAEPIADATPAIEEFVDDEELEDDVLDLAVNDEADSAISWLDDLDDFEEDDDEDVDEEPFDDFEEEPVTEADTLTGVEAELDDAISWLDEISAEPEEDLFAAEADDLEDDADELDLVETVFDEVEDEDPELTADLDFLEQQVLSEGITIAVPAAASAAVSDRELDTALNWLEAQMTAPTISPVDAALAEEMEELEAILPEEEELDVEELPDAEMLTGSLAEEDGALFDMPDDPQDAMAWLESMGAGDDSFAVEVEQPPTIEEVEDIFGDEIDEDLTALDELDWAVDEALEEIEMPEIMEEDEEADDFLGLDEDDPEAMFAALLAGGDFDIEMEPPPIKPSEDAVYVNESLYSSSAKSGKVEEELAALDELDTAVDKEIEALEELEMLEEISEIIAEDDELLDLDEDDPEAMFAALLAGGDFDIEMEPPPIKPSEDAVYVNESLYSSSAKSGKVEEELAALDELDTAVDEALEEIEALEELEMLETESIEEADDFLDLDEDDPEAMFAALLAGGDFDIEMQPPPIKPSEDAVYVDERLYGSSSKSEKVEEVVEELDTAVDEVDLSEDLDSLLDVPDDPDEAVAWLEAMAASGDALDIESDLPPIKPSDDAVYVDESLYAAQETITADMPEDPDEAVAWLEKMADQQSVDDQPSVPVESADADEEMLPAWMMSEAEDIDALLDDAPLEELGPPPDATPDEILDSSLGSPIDQDVHDALPSWLEVDDEEPPVGAQTGWLRTLPDLDVDSWLAAEEEATVRGFDEGTPLPHTSELSPTLSTTAELGGPVETEPDLFDTDELEKDEFMVIEPDSSVSMYSIDEAELKVAQDALAAENYEKAVAKYHELVSKGGGIMVLIAELETVAEKHGDHAEFRRLLGDAYMRNGQLQKALDTYKDALNHL